MSAGLCHFVLEELTGGEQLGKDGKDGKTYMTKLKKKYTGEYAGQSFTVPRGRSIAVKTFKTKKSTANIRKEAELQAVCAEAGISPRVFGVNVEEKYIAMEMLDSLPAEDCRGGRLPDDQQYMICALMGRLDSVGILHGDMNALNVMLSSNGKPYMIDFGFAKKITKTVVRKHGEHPNFTVSLWGLATGFKRYKVSVPIINECVAAAKSDSDLSLWIERGEELLTSPVNKKRKR